jgi:hypothetical protein
LPVEKKLLFQDPALFFVSLRQENTRQGKKTNRTGQDWIAPDFSMNS